MNPRFRSYLEKRAFFGLAAKALSPIAKGVGGLIRMPGTLVGKGLGVVGNEVGDMLRRGATTDKMGLGGAFLGLGMAPSMISNPFKNPEGLARNYEARNLIQGATNFNKLGAAVKIASSVLSQEDLNRSLAIRRQLEKTATAPAALSLDPAKILAAGLALGGASAVIGAGTHLAGHGVGLAQEKFRAVTQDKRFKAMTKVDPSLRNNPKARTYFGIIDRASPYIAGEPYLAAATVQQLLSTPSLSEEGVPSIQPKMLNEILNTEKVRQETRFPFMSKKDKTSLRDIASFGG